MKRAEAPADNRKLYLKFCLGKDYLLDRVKPILAEKTGNVPVCIHIEETKSTAMAPKTLWVSPDGELLSDLKAMLGEKNVVALVDAGLVKSIADLYRLNETNVAKLERFGALSAKNLINAINGSKRPSLAKFITALGIRHVGVQTAVSLAKEFKNLDNLVDASEEDLMKVSDIGEVVAESIVAWFSDEDNLKLISDLKELGVEPMTESGGTLPLSGKSYVVTGTLSSMGREEAEDKLRALGATVTSSVTKNTTALIAGEKPGKSKTEKAKKLGIATIEESELLELIIAKKTLAE
jgi:DNA ligase (NAD+)